MSTMPNDALRRDGPVLMVTTAGLRPGRGAAYRAGIPDRERAFRDLRTFFCDAR